MKGKDGKVLASHTSQQHEYRQRGDSIQYTSYYLINTEAVPLSDMVQVTATREKDRGLILIC